MIRILRITGVFAVISAVCVFAFVVFHLVVGVQGDENIRKLLDTPDVRGRFENTAHNKAKGNDDRVSPLVQQAEAFALFLNPPKEKYIKNPIKGGTGIKSVLPAVTPKFTVVATSFCQENPEKSLVLIDEPGKGRHWVKQSGKVGYLVIEQIKDGVIVVKNDQETFELTVSQKTGMNILQDLFPNSVNKNVKTASKSTSYTSNRAAANLNKFNQANIRSDEDEEKLIELVDMLKDIQKNLETDANETGEVEEDKAAQMEELISDFKSSHIGPEEAKKLGNLGEKLKDDQQDPNKSWPAKKYPTKTVQSKPVRK
jgi:hypothetical protein